MRIIAIVIAVAVSGCLSPALAGSPTIPPAVGRPAPPPSYVRPDTGCAGPKVVQRVFQRPATIVNVYQQEKPSVPLADRVQFTAQRIRKNVRSRVQSAANRIRSLAQPSGGGLFFNSKSKQAEQTCTGPDCQQTSQHNTSQSFQTNYTIERVQSLPVASVPAALPATVHPPAAPPVVYHQPAQSHVIYEYPAQTVVPQTTVPPAVPPTTPAPVNPPPLGIEAPQTNSFPIYRYQPVIQQPSQPVTKVYRPIYRPVNAALAELNSIRNRRGLHSLIEDPSLTAIARHKASIQAGRNRMYHPGGSMGSARYEGVGMGPQFTSCYQDATNVRYAGAATVASRSGNRFHCLLVR